MGCRAVSGGYRVRPATAPYRRDATHSTRPAPGTDQPSIYLGACLKIAGPGTSRIGAAQPQSPSEHQPEASTAPAGQPSLDQSAAQAVRARMPRRFELHNAHSAGRPAPRFDNRRRKGQGSAHFVVDASALRHGETVAPDVFGGGLQADASGRLQVAMRTTRQ